MMADVAGWLNGQLWPGVDQIGVVVRSADQAVESLGKTFDIGPFDIVDVEFADGLVRGEPRDFKARIAFGQLGLVQVEIIEPTAGKSIYVDHLATKGEGLHHLGFFVPDYEQRLEEMRRRGVPVLQSGRIGRGRFTYFDTQSSAGIILEYVEATPSLVKYFEKVKQLGKGGK